MSPFDIQVHCYTLKSPSIEHHHLESPINILSSLPTDPPPSHIITRARGGTRDNHVAYIPISLLMLTQPFERRSYCHGIVQSEGPWPNEKGDKVWLRSDIPLLVGHKGVPVYNITKGVCCEVWIDNVDWRWDKQHIPLPALPPQTGRHHDDSGKLILAGPARNGGVGNINWYHGGGNSPNRDDDAQHMIQMVIVSPGDFHTTIPTTPPTTTTPTTTTPTKERWSQAPPRHHHHSQQRQQTQHQIRCLTTRELEKEWGDIIGKRPYQSTPVSSGSNNGNDAVVVKRRVTVKKMPM
ncbi:hypothetical protein QBC36DRAFT_293654 [Triangularia setosa]|uniref:Uncharacterized protein n=1 Tax=Triangularia setosa TaxID=2587417 RepID=A0AAN6W0K1_9PEZI|nr:hypothetical protein QBC36DRAFT_293654 [Podospora setosa]